VVSNDSVIREGLVSSLVSIGESSEQKGGLKRVLKGKTPSRAMFITIQNININEAITTSCPSTTTSKREVRRKTQTTSSCVVLTCSIDADTEVMGDEPETTAQPLLSRYQDSMSPKGTSFMQSLDDSEVEDVTYLGQGKYEFSRLVGDENEDNENWILPLAVSGASLLCCCACFGAYKADKRKKNDIHELLEDDEEISLHSQIQKEIKSESRRTSHSESSVAGDI